MANLALKYRPQSFEDVTEQSVVVDMLKHICEAGELENRNFLLIGPAGTGKAQPMYSKILTPHGFINMRDVHIGQEVFTANGNIGKVIGIYPQGVRPIYEITLQDRTKIRVSDEHLNVCYRYNQDLKRREDFCMTTTELVDFNKSSKFKLRVDIPKVTWQSDVTPIDPYLLGALLGDGSLSSGNFGFSNSEPDVVDKVDKILRRDWNKYLKKRNGDNVDYDIANVHQAYHKYTIKYQGNSFTSLSDVADALSLAGYPKFDSSTILRLCEGTATNTLKQYPELAKELTCSIDPNYRNWQEIDPLRAALAELKLTAKSTEKHIPAEYLYATEDVRLELLRGLYDTDGYTDVHGVTSYTTCSDQLSEDFAFLVRSLGIRDTIVDAPSCYKHDGIRHFTGTVAHTHNLKIPNDMLYCSSVKHLNRRKHRQHEPMRNIIDIKYIGDEECQCIMLDHPDHTYISDDFIPTHNTTSARIMANMLNNNLGEPIEVDAASHSGVDSIREIIQQAKAFPVGCKYKVFIIDECFPGNTWISTPSGNIQIKDICEGDRIHNMTGTATVTRVFKNDVKISNLICLRLGARNVITTKDHLFFTDCGWVPARELKQGDILYDYSTMQTMRKRIHCEVQERPEASVQSGMPQNLHPQQDVRKVYKFVSERVSSMWKDLLDSKECKCCDVFRKVWLSMEETESQYGPVIGATCKTLAYIYMSRMREADGDTEQRPSESMFAIMCKQDECSESSQACSSKYLSMVWKYIYSELRRPSQENVFTSMPNSVDNKSSYRSKESEIIGVDDEAQSDVKSRYCSEDDSNSREEWHITQAACLAWWERTLHEAADDAQGSFRRDVEVRVSCSDASSTKQSESLSYELQTRPRLSRISPRDRGGWCRPSYEIASVARRKESDAASAVRVDSVTIYKRGDNDELFRSSFSDSELSQDYVTMYDLEIDGHPSYYANNILVHNCHAISSAGWQSMLKAFEDGVGRSVFVLCTTNPEKIPATIISRVQVFQLSKISLAGIVSRLKYVLDSEIKEGRSITYTDDAVSFIAKLANGGMRDSLTLLDKALTYSNNITTENLVCALNLPNYDDYFTLLGACAKKDNTAITNVVNTVYNSGVNFVKWFEGFHGFVMNVVKYIFLQDINETTIPSHYKEKISKYTSAHAAICLKLANKLLQLNYELKSTQYLQEVALTHLCTVPKKEGH